MSTVFDLSGLLVLPVWFLMIALPRWRWTERLVATPLVAAAPAILYLVLVAPRLAEVFPIVLSPSLDRVAELLGSPAGATIAWAHFLAFDLFVGRWIYLDARERKLPAPVTSPLLVLTILLAPIGLAGYLAARTIRTPARASIG